MDRSFANLDELTEALRRDSPGAPGVGRVVPGEGPVGAAIAFVGEQPGDVEDRLGRPFVGPAGRLFDRALAEAEIDRAGTYVTNAVKRFHWTERGKRRLHRRPSGEEITHERRWLGLELDLVGPRLVVALGAVAALALAGRSVAVTRERGPFGFDGRRGFVTLHPSALLRIPDEDERRRAFQTYVDDLRLIREMAA